MLKNERYQELMIVSLFVLGIILSILLIGTTLDNKFFLDPKNDAEKYYRMSYNVLDNVGGLQQGRILVPFLVYLMPVDHLIGFYIINLVSLLLLGIIFYYYIRKLNFNKREALIGVLLLLLSPTMIYTIRNICLVDIPSFLIFLVAFYAILEKNDKMYLISLIVGILNKETILLTLPVYFFCKARDNNALSAFKSTLVIALPALILFLCIKFFIGSAAGYVILDAVMSYYQSRGLLYIMSQAYMPFGSLWLLSAANITCIDSKFLKYNFYIMLVVVLLETTILAGTDIFRIIFILFPVIIPISLYMFKIKYPSIVTYLICGITILFLISSIIYMRLLPLTEVGVFSAYYSILFQLLILLLLGISQFKDRGSSFAS